MASARRGRGVLATLLLAAAVFSSWLQPAVFAGQSARPAAQRSAVALAAKRLSAYNMYQKEVMGDEQFKQEAKAQGINPFSLCAMQWKEVSEQAKMEYQEAAEALNAQREADGELKAKKTTSKKRQITGYQAYIKSFKGTEEWKETGLSFMAAMGAQWKALSEAEKQQWKTQATLM
mmetsp:Transcript_26199/g.47862  ORF Transcript_26199/g.47862 Transcript_26199/m.47862 type:complete len:176 (+) Transcript_26199:74-601(+)